jgi:hypothetical protein
MPILTSTDPNIDYKGCALSAARSKLAYLDPDDLKKIWLSSSIDDKNIHYYIFKDVIHEPKYYFDANTGVNAYSWIQDRTLYIIFRGTEGKDDVKIDIDIVRSSLFPDNPSIKVHSGFLKQFRSIKTVLIDEISAKSELIDVVHFNGHSLGGALATLAAGFFGPVIHSIMGLRVICHTIGSPRIGNKDFVAWWSGKVDESMRILNVKDPVPLLPVNGFYTHINGGLEINDHLEVKILERDLPWYLRLICLPFEIYYRNPIQNHKCDLYISRLLKLADWDIICN